MKYNKGFIGIGMIVAIIAALAVGGGVVYYATKTPAPSSSTEENNYQPQANTQNTNSPTQNAQTNSTPPAKNNSNPPVQTSGTMNVSVYFANTISNPGFPDCRVNYSVSRSIPQTQAVARASLEQLLQGPTTAEYNAGYRTFLGTGITINSLTITNGVAHVDFATLTGPGGTCGVAGMVSQIRNTLLQFSTIQSVNMTVNGQDASIILEGMI